MSKHVAWRLAALVVVLTTAACSGGTNLEGDVPDGREGGDGEAEADACVPDCDGRECGDDGCGGTCAPGCGADELCIALSGECSPRRGWIQVPPTSPPPGSMAYDSARGVVVLFGSAPGDLAATWEYDGTSWAEVATPAAPPAREGHGMVYDSARGVVVLFGGEWCEPYSGCNLFADTWEYDGTSWTEVTTPTSPPARKDHAMAYDSARGVVVLFGGLDPATGAFSDTWEFDGTSWTEIATPTAPPEARPMVYNAARGVVVLFGGYASGDTLLTATWEYDGATWSEVATPTSPLARIRHAMAYDAARDVVVLFGGCLPGMMGSCVDLADTWEFDGTTWAEVSTPTSPAARSAHAMAYDSARGVVVLFGGEGRGDVADTWEYEGTAWTKTVAPASPFSRYNHAMAYDAAREVVVLFGGYHERELEDTWEFDGRSWVEVATGNRPSARHNHAMAYDAARRVVVLFSGEQGTYEGDLAPADTWEYDGTTWTEVSLGSPPARLGHAMAYDAARGVVVLFGGGGGRSAPRADTWEFDGTTWTEIAAPTSPGARFHHTMAYDSARGVVVLFGGYADAWTILTDTWEYDGTTWTEVATPVSPWFPDPGHPTMHARWHEIVFDSSRATAMLFDGLGTWEYDAMTWTSVATPTAPSLRYDYVMTYDSTRGIPVLFGGQDSPDTLGDTWEYYGP